MHTVTLEIRLEAPAVVTKFRRSVSYSGGLVYLPSLSGWLKSVLDVSVWFLLVKSVVWQVCMQPFFPRICRPSPGFAAVENRDFESLLAFFSHSRWPDLPEIPWRQSLPACDLGLLSGNLLKVEQCVMDALVIIHAIDQIIPPERVQASTSFYWGTAALGEAKEKYWSDQWT